jgi:capsular exopolysaccharide synthesis family protein
VEAKKQSPGQYAPTDLSAQRPYEELLMTLLRGKWVIAITAAVVFVLTALYTFTSKPVYEASSMIIVEERGRSGTLPFLDITGAASQTKITNELETLKARSTSEAVARALLDRTFVDAAKSRFIPMILKADAEKGVNVKDTLPAVTQRLIRKVEFTPVKESDIIRVTVKSNDPVEAALIANMYSEVYTQRNTSASRVKSRAIREFLQSQMQSKHGSLDSSENALQNYMRNSGVVTLDAEANKVVDQLSALEATRDGIEVDISTRSKTLNSLKQELAVQEPNVAKAIGESNDTYIRLLQEQLARLEVQRDVVIAQNPELADQKIYSEKLKEIDTQIVSLRNNLKARTETFMSTIVPGERTNNPEGGTATFLSQVKQRIIEQQIELDGLAARKAALNVVVRDYEKQFNQIPRKSMELAKLQRSRMSNEKLYLLVEEKFNEAAIKETSELGYVNIMDPAVIPTDPISPKVIPNLFMGVVIGLFLGIGLVVVRARMDDRIQSPLDLKKRGIIPLSTIGKIDIERPAEGTVEPGIAAEGKRLGDHLVSFYSPLSSTSEAYRHLRTSVMCSRPDHPLKTILVTSPNPEEGKSTTICNLAISFAQAENRVLLVDSDMRRPSVHKQFNLEQDPGLTESFFAKKTFEQVVHRKVVENLDVLCCGTIPPNPAEILNSHRMREYIDRLKSSYDIVMFDTPPLLAVTDAAILSRKVDGVLVVICAGKTGFSSLDRAGEILQSVGSLPLGVALNNFDMKTAYGGYYGKNKSDRYSYSYGYASTPSKTGEGAKGFVNQVRNAFANYGNGTEKKGQNNGK